MTELSGPWDGTTVGDAAVTAPYSSNEWGRIWRGLFRASKVNDGPIAGSGVSPDVGLTVTATTPGSKSVDVSAGAALVRGAWYESDATVNLVVGANASGNPRIDTVVLQKNYTLQTVRLVIWPGTPAATPIPEPLSQIDGSFWQVPIAYITLANGYASVAQSDIVPCRNYANAADGVYLLDILNNSGAALDYGMLVVWDVTADRAVKTTTTVGDPNVAGVWQGYTPAGGYGRLLVRGITYLNTLGVVSRSNVFCASGVAGFAAHMGIGTDSDSKKAGVGIALGTAPSTGVTLAYIDVEARRPTAFTQKDGCTGSTTTNAGFTDVTGAEVTITTHTGRVRVTCMCRSAIAVAGTTGYLDLYSVGLTARAGNATFGLQTVYDPNHANVMMGFTVVGYFSGLATGVAQAFRLQQRAASGGGCQIGTDAVLFMYAEEF